MRKQTIVAVAAMVLLGSGPVLAADVDSEVEALKQELGLGAEDVAELKSLLQTVRTAGVSIASASSTG